MQHTRRGSVFGLLASLLVMVLGLGAAGPATGFGSGLPAHVHPGVLQQTLGHPGATLRVIVMKAAGAEGVEAAAIAAGGRVTGSWPMINAFGVELEASGLAALSRIPGVRAVLADHPVSSTKVGKGQGHSEPALPYVMAVKAHNMWNEGFTGAGVTVAVVDTGIYSDPASPTDFGNRVLANVAVNEAATTSTDEYGHGTHVAAIVGGNGLHSGGAYSGIAPGVNLVNVKIDDGTGSASERDLLTGLQWVYDHRAEYNIRVVNISSTVTTAVSYLESPTAAAVEQLWMNGVVVVVAAGNQGSDPCAVCRPPANDPFVIAVGAVDDNGTSVLSDDFMKEWSSRGTTQDGFAKPDLVAPGAQIISYMPVGALRQAAPGNIVDTHYFRMGGTSMSAPVVSGVVALLLQARPDLTPNQVKWLLQTTARGYRDRPPETPGIVNAMSAAEYKQPVGSANQGIAPSTLLDPSDGTIDYSNVLWGNVLWGNVLWGNSPDY
ncbi:MAG: S8 family peptidase [Bacillota bacterium]